MAYGRLAADLDGGDGLPLFPDLKAAFPLRWPVTTPSPFEDPLLLELVESLPVQRLRRIGFLGAVDRIRSRNKHNRYDHSVGVARLALLYATQRTLSRHDARVLAVTGLLHDVGHGPLSHTLEPVFHSRFGISHHKTGREIVRGDSPLGQEVPKILARHRIDPDEVNAMIEGTHQSQHAFLFSNPINLDTIEGITRCYSFARTRKSVAVSADSMVRALAERDTLPTQVLDAFWLLKHQMYNLLIHHPLGLLYDGLAQAIVEQNIKDFRRRDFLLDEEQLRCSKRQLFTVLDQARQSSYALREHLPDSILSHEITVPTRTFECNTTVELKRSTDLDNRYVQAVTFHKVTIDNLIPEEDPTGWHHHITQGELSMNASCAPMTASSGCERQLWTDSAMLRSS